MATVEIYQGDCLEIMPTLPQVDAIITDLPYGTTACSWDEIIPFEPMWKEVKRILKPRGVFVTTASQPFTSRLINSNLDMFKYEWVWNKQSKSNFLQANFQPLKIHENILVFSQFAVSFSSGNISAIYNPQKTKGQSMRSIKSKQSKTWEDRTNKNYKIESKESNTRYPTSIINIFNDYRTRKLFGYHPTQKPVALLEYLIRTYTNEGDTVLDICAGSGTTGVAAINTGRNAILIEKESKYIEIIEKRIAQAQQQPSLLEKGLHCN